MMCAPAPMAKERKLWLLKTEVITSFDIQAENKKQEAEPSTQDVPVRC